MTSDEKLNELFSTAALASHVLWSPYYRFSVKNMLMKLSEEMSFSFMLNIYY